MKAPLNTCTTTEQRGVVRFLLAKNMETKDIHKEMLPIWAAYMAVVGYRPGLETRPPPHSHGKRRLRLQFERAPDDEHDSARNMLSGVYVTK
jgi:hypothetical protein